MYVCKYMYLLCMYMYDDKNIFPVAHSLIV